MDVKLTIDRFEGENAVLILESGESLVWLKKILPLDAQEGSVLRIKITTDGEEEKNKKALAKEILNEILDT